jgi:DNA-binding response OmpR family regulator
MFHFLIIEPNTELTHPYTWLDQVYSKNYTFSRCSRLDVAKSELAKNTPSAVFLSTNFSPLKTLHFLEEFKTQFSSQVVPLIFVVDWSQRIHRLLGTGWAGKVGILHSLSSEEEVSATMKRLLG